MKLHVITDGKKTEEELVNIFSRIHSYVDMIHIREKHRTARELMDLGEKLLDKGVPAKKLIINDRVDVAHALGVRGVQLAYHSMEVSQVRRCFPTLLVGRSVHSYKEVIQAEQEGADFVLYGHVYPTKSKEGLKPRGLDELKEEIQVCSIPIIAIGGITLEKTGELRSCGVSGIAIMSGIMGATNFVEAAKAYKSSLLVEE
jgi:thiazole tautomerase (transcriptional regulator TenI)